MRQELNQITTVLRRGLRRAQVLRAESGSLQPHKGLGFGHTALMLASEKGEG